MIAEQHKLVKTRRFINLFLKTVLWTLAVPVLVFLVTIIGLQFPAVQTWLAKKAVAYASEKTGADVSLKKLGLSFSGNALLEDLLVYDKKHDTIVYSHTLSLGIDLPALLSKKIQLNVLDIETATAHITRDSSGFNFDFIIDGFASGRKDTLASIGATAGWQFSLHRVQFRHCYATYTDQVSGIALNARLGTFKARIDEFDLPHDRLQVVDLSLDSSRVWLQQEVIPGNDSTASQPPGFQLGVSSAALSQTQFTYISKSDGLNLDVSVGRLELKVKNIDLARYRFNVSELALSNSSVSCTQEINHPATVKEQLSDSATGIPWLVTVKKLSLEHNFFTYNDKNKLPAQKGVDYGHLQVRELNLEAKQVYVSNDKIKGQLDRLAFNEKCGFELVGAQAEIVCDLNHISLSGLDLQTAKSRVSGNLEINYPSLRSLVASPDGIGLDAKFDKTAVTMSDLFYFVPDLFKQSYPASGKYAVVLLNGRLHGNSANLEISKFSLQVSSGISLFLDGTVENITRREQFYAKLNSFRFSGTRQAVLAWIPDSILPGTIELPETFLVKGSFNGYLKNFNADAGAQTSIGNISTVIKMNPSAGNQEQPYHLQMKSKAFDLGRFLKQPETFGLVTLEASMDGSGWDTSNIKADVKVEIEKGVFKRYEYQSLALSGRLDKLSFAGKASAGDPNLSFVFDGNIDMDPRHPEYDFKLDLKGADLQALNLTKEEMRLSAYVESHISDHHQNNVSGKAAIRDLLLIRQNKKYRLDSLVLTSELKDSIWDISIASEIVQAKLKGDITLVQLPELLSTHVNNYFRFRDSVPGRQLRPQRFEFEAKLINPTALAGEVIPGLGKIASSSIKGSYNSEAMELQLRLDVPEIIYSGIKMDSIRLVVQSDRTKMAYRLNVTEVSNSSLKTENLSLGGELKNNSLTFQLNTNKDDSTKLLALGGIVKALPGKKYELNINPELIFNAQPWSVRPGNVLVFGREGLYADQLVISSGNHEVSLNSAEKKERSPVEIRFTDFDLATISKLLENNNELIRGLMNGSVILEKHEGIPAFRSDLVIRDFAFKAVPVGTIRLKADNFESPRKYAIHLKIEGSHNDIEANGSYLAAGKNGNMDFILSVNQLDLATIEPFTFGQLSRMSGSVNGKLHLKGDPAKPDIAGTLYLKEAACRPKILDSYLVAHEGKWLFEDKKIRFPNLVIYDSLDHRGTVNGFADIHDFNNIGFDMQVKTDNFLVLNTDRKDNPLYYGRIFLDSDIRLKGTMNAPDLDIKARLNKGTSVTYVRPESVVGKNESKGIVEFTDSLHRDTTIMMRINDSIGGISAMKGVNLDATISFDRSVELKIIVDQETGDSLYLVGGGTLDFSLDRNGKTSLTGRYRIDNGGYYLAVNDLVKRNFKIERGSYVSWSGDMLDAYIDLKAVYTVKTSPIDLVQEEVSGMGELERNKYRNLLTFNVYLKMTGFISSPEISFDIQLAPGDRGAMNGAINSRLAQLREDDTEMNKQVFALLTLRRFVSENPLDKGDGGGGFSSASRSSASKVLTQQLSSLSDRYVNFVDLDLGVNSFEDYSTGRQEGRTQLQLGVSKQLLKDKVTVRVGGNVELEGERASQNNASDVAGNISIDYKLTGDGRYKLKAFRENQYENPIEGELTKTGMGIIFIRNYNTFRELFAKPVKRNEGSNGNTNGNSTVRNENDKIQ